MNIRVATVADIDGYMKVRFGVKENVLNDPSLVTEEDNIAYLTDHGRGWVCEIDHKIVGFAIVSLQKRNIWALFVLPEHEGKGIGSKLHGIMLEWYFSQTNETIWLSTDKTSKACKFYKSKGWSQVGDYGNNEFKFEMSQKDWELQNNSNLKYMNDNITYGKAKLSDSLRISLLFKTIYFQTYESKGVTFEFANFVTQRFSPENIEKIIQSEKTDLIVAYIEDNPIGAAQINYDTLCKIRKTPVTELDKLYVLPNYHGKGVGAGLMRQVEEILRAKGIKEVNLIVYIHNQKAVKFYQKTGFVTLGNFDYQMEENSYVNLVMNKVL